MSTDIHLVAQTMAHQPMHINHWIEIDKEYKWYIDEKARVIAEQGWLNDH